MRPAARRVVAVLLAVGLCDLPTLASSEKPLGVVAQAQHASLDNAAATMGASVFVGDTFETESNGTIRLRIGTNQVYLSASSAVAIGIDSDGTIVTLKRGVAGFSSPSFQHLGLATPAGILRGTEGKPAYGQVTMTGPSELVVSAFRGDLILDNEGELHTIPEGKSYRVEIQDNQQASSGDNPDFHPAENHHRRRKLAFYLILTGAIAFATYEIWNELSESPSKPSR